MPEQKESKRIKRYIENNWNRNRWSLGQHIYKQHLETRFSGIMEMSGKRRWPSSYD